MQLHLNIVALFGLSENTGYPVYGVATSMSDDKSKDVTAASSMVFVARYLGLAFLIPMSAGAGWLLGSYLDRHLNTSYWSTICLVLGIVGSFIQLIRELLRDSNKQ